MGEILRNAVEKRRQSLIDKLIAFQTYKKDNKHLFELSLTELENEYKTLQQLCHPHNNFDSIKIPGKKRRI